MADRYWVGGNDDWNATAGTKWALTSGGTGGEAVPTSSDAVYLDNGTGHGNVTVTATASCLSLNCTGYADTLTVNAILSVSGAITLEGTGMTSAGSSLIRALVSATLTSDGHTWGAGLGLAGSSQTYTLADAWVISGALSITGSVVTLNDFTLSAAGLTLSTTLSGDTDLTLTGGTWSGNQGLANNLTLAGDVTISGTVLKSAGTLTRSSGTITVTSSILRLLTATINTPGMTWNEVRGEANGTITVTSLSATTIRLGNSTTTWGGAAGFTCTNLTVATISGSSKTHTLTQTNTYAVTGDVTLVCTDALRLTLASSSGTLRVPLTFSGSTQNVQFVNATRIDSSGGNTIHSLNGVLVDSLNWDTGATGTMWLYS